MTTKRLEFSVYAIVLLLMPLSLLGGLIGCGGGIRLPRGQSVGLADDAALPGASTVNTAFDWKKEIGDILDHTGAWQATLNEKEQVYTVTIPRTDLDLKIDGMPVPTSAGLASTIHFYRCSCGKMSVLGEFIAIDYEANDVIDALRPGNLIRVSGVCPIAIGDRPRLLVVRFQGEGEATPLGKLVREALRWTGEERMKPRND
jgi:Domain of Unknown Function (DUF1259)